MRIGTLFTYLFSDFVEILSIVLNIGVIKVEKYLVFVLFVLEKFLVIKSWGRR